MSRRGTVPYGRREVFQWGFAHGLCLGVTAGSMGSILEHLLSPVVPRSERKRIPFIVAVDQDLREGTEGDEGCGFDECFSIAVKSRPDDLFVVMRQKFDTK